MNGFASAIRAVKSGLHEFPEACFQAREVFDFSQLALASKAWFRASLDCHRIKFSSSFGISFKATKLRVDRPCFST
jgi:hypothetical protein